MPKYVIERTVPGSGDMTSDDLRGIAAQSNTVIHSLGPDIQWVHSYVVEDKLFCVYNAKDPDIIYEHARCGGFPIDFVHKVKEVIDPVTAEPASV